VSQDETPTDFFFIVPGIPGKVIFEGRLTADPFKAF